MKGSVPISCDTCYPPGHCYWSGSGICCLSPFLGSPDRRTGAIIHLFAKVLQILYILPKGRTTFAEWVAAINTRQATLWTLSPHFCWKLHQVNHSETPLVLWFVQSSGGEIKHLWEDSSSSCRKSRGRKDPSCASPDGSCKHQLVPASAQERQVQNFPACVACEWNPLECCLFPARKYSSLQFKPWPINTCLFKNQS